MEESEIRPGSFYCLWGLIQTYTVTFLVQGFYLMCYKLELPMIEKYKCIEEPWPWNDDKENWNKLYWRTIALYTLN